MELFAPWLVGGVRGTVHSVKLEADAALRARLELPYAMAHVTLEEPEHTGAGVLRQILRSRQSGQRPWLQPQLLQLPRALGDAAQWILHAIWRKRRFISTGATIALRLNLAQQLGMPTGGELSHKKLDRRVSPADREALRRFAGLVRDRLAELGFGDGDGLAWNSGLVSGAGELTGVDDARHLMGGACMGVDPRWSVVDGNLQVHGIRNLHLASAAVLPDGRAQLPTMTLMALSLRLADRLGADLNTAGAL